MTENLKQQLFAPQTTALTDYWASFLKKALTQEELQRFREKLIKHIEESAIALLTTTYNEIRFGIGANMPGHSAYDDSYLKNSLLAIGEKHSQVEHLLPRSTHTILNVRTKEIFLEQKTKEKDIIIRRQLRVRRKAA